MYKAVGGKDTSAINDWTRDRLSNRVYDVNSRGTIANKNLWTDDKDDRRDRRGGGGRGKPEDGRPGDKEKLSNDKIYQRNANNPATYQGPYADAGAVQQSLQEVAPLVNCTPCTVPPLMQCTTDVQLVQSMSALHLYPATGMQLGPTFVPGLAAMSPSVICDGATENASKEVIIKRMIRTILEENIMLCMFTRIFMTVLIMLLFLSLRIMDCYCLVFYDT